jgi:hypothetical protein
MSGNNQNAVRERRAMSAAVTIFGLLAHEPHARKHRVLEGFAGVFPRHPGTRPCQIRAGPAGHVFKGSCRTQVHLHRDGSAEVVFTQSIQGVTRTWFVRVLSGQPPSVAEVTGALPRDPFD